MHVYALLYDYTMSMYLPVYASCVAQLVILVHALYVFLTFLGSMPVIFLLFLLLAPNVIQYCSNIIHPEYDIMDYMIS